MTINNVKNLKYMLQTSYGLGMKAYAKIGSQKSKYNKYVLLTSIQQSFFETFLTLKVFLIDNIVQFANIFEAGKLFWIYKALRLKLMVSHWAEVPNIIALDSLPLLTNLLKRLEIRSL